MDKHLTKKELSEILEEPTIEDKIRELANIEMEKLAKKVQDRVIEMELDNDDHYLIYGVLGVDKDEIIEIITDALCGDTKDYENANGFISTVDPGISQLFVVLSILLYMAL